MGDRFARIPACAVACQQLSAADWRVLACIALHADGAGRAFPGMTTIATMTGLARRNVPRSIRRIEQFGLLRREHRSQSTGSADANIYILNLGNDPPVAALRQRCVLNPEDRVSSSLRTRVLKSTLGGVLTGEDLTDHKNRLTADAHAHRPATRSARARIRDGVEGSASGEFETFWRICPSRHPHANPKKPARLKFEAAVKRGVDPADIIRGAENYRAAVESTGTDPRYIAQAVTWLNQERWNDYQKAPEPQRLRVGMN